MKRFSYNFDRHIAQAMYGAFCLFTALALFYSPFSTESYLRAWFSSSAEFFACVLICSGALLALDAVVRVLPSQFFIRAMRSKTLDEVEAVVAAYSIASANKAGAK